MAPATAPRRAPILITGATAGIGYEAARLLALQEYPIVVHGRSATSAAEACERLQQAVPQGDFAAVWGDLSTRAGVSHVAEAVRRITPQLSTLLNNAGLMVTHRALTTDGHELTLAVNHLAAFQLTLELLPLLEANGQARIVTVSSEAHRIASLDLNDLDLSRGFGGIRAYANSKLMNLLFTYELSRRLNHRNVTANALHPGFVRSRFDRNLDGWYRLLWAVGQPFALSPEAGAACSVYAAASPRIANHSGKYFVRLHSASSSNASHNANTARTLWQLSEELTGVKFA